MSSNMTINVKFLPGTEIEDAVIEAKEKAKLWKVAYVTFEFNGASFAVGENADVEDAVNEWKATEGKPYGIIAP